MAEVDKYCAVWDYDISDVVYADGVSSSAGGAGRRDSHSWPELW